MSRSSTKDFKRHDSFQNVKPVEINMDVQMKILRTIGLWQDEDSGSEMIWRLYPYYKVVLLIIIFIHLLSLANGMFYYWGDMESVCMIVSMFLSFIEVSFKIIDAYLYRDKIQRLLTTLLDDFPGVKILYSKGYNAIVKDSLLTCNKLCKVYLYVGIAAGGTWCIEPILDRFLSYFLHPDEEYEWTLPFIAKFPVNMQETPYYQILYVYQAIVAIIGTAVTIAADMLFLSLMIFTATHLRLLGQSLEEMRLRPQGMPSSQYGSFRDVSEEELAEGTKKNLEVHERESYMHLVECVKHHKSVISFAADLESIISPVMLFQFMATTLEICLAGFQAKLGGMMGSSFFKFMLYTISNIIQTFCYCKFGDNIIFESNNLTMASYNSEWYEGSEKFKKMLRILILRSQKPLTLWAGKFYAVSLETFSNLMHHSYSFFTLLSQMHE